MTLFSKPKPSFQLLRLPLIALRVVVGQMDVVSVIEMSLMSIIFKRIISFLKVFRIDCFEFHLCHQFLGIVIKDQGQAIALQVLPETKSKFICKVNGIPVVMSRRITVYQKKNHFKIQVKPKGSLIEKKFEMVENLTKHFLGFIKNPKFTFHSDMSVISGFIEKCFVFNYTKSFDTLELSQIGYMKLLMTPEGLNFLQEMLQIDEIRLNLTLTDPEFEYTHPLKNRVQSLTSPSWISLQTLMSSPDCELLEYKNLSPTFPLIDVNLFLRGWIDGKHPKMEELMVWSTGVDNELMQQIFMGMNSILSDFGNYELRVHAHPVESVYQRDIRRTHDDRLASVCFSEGRVAVYVWHNKHLKALGRDIIEDVDELQ